MGRICKGVTTFGSIHAKMRLCADAEQFPGCLTSSLTFSSRLSPFSAALGFTASSNTFSSRSHPSVNTTLMFTLHHSTHAVFTGPARILVLPLSQAEQVRVRGSGVAVDWWSGNPQVARGQCDMELDSSLD